MFPLQRANHMQKRKRVVNLEIPDEWRFWSGFYPGGPEVVWLADAGYGREDELRGMIEDPMDEDDFTESTAFPSVKPNVEVFGAPRYSRKQRGWYQLKEWPQRMPSLLSDSDSRPALATAADIPPEIFERILGQEVALEHDKHTLSNCAQVCRYWAANCRPRLFARLTLRSKRDVLDLRDFMRDPACLFLPYLKETPAQVHDLSKFDWMHIFTQMWDGDCIQLWLFGPTPKGWKSARSIHQTIPRSLPRHFSRKIDTLNLIDIHVRRFHDLTYLVGELPDLKKLRCEKVSWEGLLTGLPHRRPTVNRNSLQEWEMKDCNPSCVRAAWFLFLSIYSTASYLFDGDLPGIRSLLEPLDHDITETSYGYDYPDAMFLYIRSRSIELDLTIQRRSLCQETPSFRLTAIGIGLFHNADEEGGKALVDWGTFDISVSKFRHLQTACLGFEDRKRMLRFAEEVIDAQMPLLSEYGLVRYALRDGLWYHQASRESDKLQGGGKSLRYVYA